ncbi:hypothetical protein [Enterobacter sp. KBR-315C3_2022]|uniref:hypothetical protein n=1 Tax=Enterobacter sp. KBR-315C3_2022 TaxID=3242494 RepID=UPI0035293F16
MVLKSDIENDANKIIDSLKKDYRIPTSGEIIFPVIKVMSIVYAMHIIAIFGNEFVYKKDIWFPGVIMWLVLSCGILTVVALMMTYANLSMLMCIPKDVRDKSILLNVGKQKLKIYGCIIIAINIVVAIVLISERSDFIIGYGFSWFASFLIGGVVFSMSMSRYMTPAVVATLDKIRQVVSSPQMSSNSEEV